MSFKYEYILPPNRVKEVYRLEEMEKIFVRYQLLMFVTMHVMLRHVSYKN